jgi:hypothetical protein
MLLQERGFSYALGAFDANDSRLPVDPAIDLALEVKAYLRDQSVRVSVQYVRI